MSCISCATGVARFQEVDDDTRIFCDSQCQYDFYQPVDRPAAKAAAALKAAEAAAALKNPLHIDIEPDFLARVREMIDNSTDVRREFRYDRIRIATNAATDFMMIHGIKDDANNTERDKYITAFFAIFYDPKFAKTLKDSSRWTSDDYRVKVALMVAFAQETAPGGMFDYTMYAHIVDRIWDIITQPQSGFDLTTILGTLKELGDDKTIKRLLAKANRKRLTAHDAWRVIHNFDVLHGDNILGKTNAINALLEKYIKRK